MAELIQVRMKDFRAFRSASLDLAPSGLNLITGPNNSGKSSLVSAFDVVAGLEMSAVRHSLGKRAQVWARFELDDEERSALLEPTPDLARLLDAGAAKWVEWEFNDIGDRMPAVAVRLKWVGDKQIDVAVASIFEHSWSLMAVPPPLSSSSFELAQMGGGSGMQPIDPLVELVNVHALRPIKEILPEWRRGFFHFSPLRQSPGRVSPTSKIVPVLQSDGSNLPAVLLHMYTNNPTAWDELQRLLVSIVPGVGTMMTPVNQNVFQVQFSHEYDYTDMYNDTYRTEYYRHNLKDLGTGVEQTLMTLVVGLTQAARTVVIEEPETGLHPGAQRALLSLLQEWSKDRLFFATTHSSAMLDWSSPETKVYGVSRRSAESSVALVELVRERAEVLWDLGVRLSDVLSAERMLIHEGPTDGPILTEWFPMLIRDPRIVMIPGRGGANARHADLFASWVESADGLGTRKMLYLRDRDELSGKLLDKLEASPNVYVLSCREIENFLLDFDAIAQVLSTSPECRDLEPVDANVLRFRAKALADELKQAVVLKRVIQERLGALYLLDSDVREILVRQNAGLTELIAAVIPRLPRESTLRAELEASWQRNQRQIDDSWEENWLSIVPGADLLTRIWQEYLGRGYSKTVDGALLAAQVSPPEELVEAVGSFIEDA